MTSPLRKYINTATARHVERADSSGSRPDLFDVVLQASVIAGYVLVFGLFASHLISGR